MYPFQHEVVVGYSGVLERFARIVDSILRSIYTYTRSGEHWALHAAEATPTTVLLAAAEVSICGAVGIQEPESRTVDDPGAFMRISSHGGSRQTRAVVQMLFVAKYWIGKCSHMLHGFRASPTSGGALEGAATARCQGFAGTKVSSSAIRAQKHDGQGAMRTERFTQDTQSLM